MKTIKYSENTLNGIFSSKDVREKIYLDGIKQGECFIKELKKN